jgi:hypothetical protein
MLIQSSPVNITILSLIPTILTLIVITAEVFIGFKFGMTITKLEKYYWKKIPNRIKGDPLIISSDNKLVRKEI